MMLLRYLNKRADAYGLQSITFGIFGILNYPLSYIYHVYQNGYNVEELVLRLIATALCAILALKNYWPRALKPYLALYWYVTIFFCLPFFATYSLLLSHFALSWLMNNVLGLFLLVLIVDGAMLIILLTLGIFLGIMMFYLINEPFTLNVPQEHIVMAAYMYAFAIIVGGVFSHNREKSVKSRLTTMKSMAGSIAHEMRTPLVGVLSSISAFKEYFPKILAGYKKAVKAGVHDTQIDLVKIKLLEVSAETMEELARSGLITIDMLLMKVKDTNYSLETSKYKIVSCIKTALNSYPLTDKETNLIKLNTQEDFSFIANKQMIIHVIFNLLKNALYYVHAAGKGDITITTKREDKYNVLIFRDTGQGVPKKLQKRIFEKFYTSTSHGTGIGLAFCKEVMETMGGNIYLLSEEGEYTEFTLQFPKI